MLVFPLISGCVGNGSASNAADARTEPLPTFSMQQAGAVPAVSVSPPRQLSSPTTTPLPVATASSSPSFPVADRIWKTLTAGQAIPEVVVRFETDSAQHPCLRYIVQGKNTATAQSPRRCLGSTASSRSSVILALQGSETDSKGNAFTVIVGRVFSDRVTAISLEIADGTNMPLEVDDSGFGVVLPGKHPALRAIPIDQYGNLAGDKFSFN